MTISKRCGLVRLLWVAFALTAGSTASSAAAAAPQLLYDPTTLKSALNDSEPPVVVDVRPQAAYDAGHVPSARWVDTNLWRDTTLTPTGLSDRQFWEQQLAELGLTRHSKVVVVGDALPEAARVWWLLRYLGLPQTGVLDGGHAAWGDAGYPLSRERVEFAASQPQIELQEEMLAELASVQPAVGGPAECTILDNRSQAEYSGTRGVGTRTGHIPGARHVEWNRFVGPQGKLLPADEIRSVLAEERIDVSSPIVAHCQTGGRSSVAVLALEVAGVRDVKNYYRGWSEYASALTAPVEK